jgi:hypothetical protein
MNEKIKNLWDTALEEFSKEHQFATIMLPEPLREKFAELIVQECISVVEQQKAKMSYGPTFVIEDIKKHFGVEE